MTNEKICAVDDGCFSLTLCNLSESIRFVITSLFKTADDGFAYTKNLVPIKSSLTC